MKNAMSLIASVAFVAVSSLAAIAPASAASAMGNPGMGHANPAQQQQFVMNWCKSNARDPSCRDFDSHKHQWSNSQYQSWYSSHHSMRGFDPMAAAIFGITAAAVGSAIHSSQPHLTRHQQACVAKYGSFYNPASNTYKMPGRGPRTCNL